jgi:hypothetical protein
MTEFAHKQLKHRSERLRHLLNHGANGEIAAARELLRLSLVELYREGYWQKEPAELQRHMRIYRAAEPHGLSAPESMSAPDKMARYSL